MCAVSMFRVGRFETGRRRVELHVALPGGVNCLGVCFSLDLRRNEETVNIRPIHARSHHSLEGLNVPLLNRLGHRWHVDWAASKTDARAGTHESRVRSAVRRLPSRGMSSPFSLAPLLNKLHDLSIRFPTTQHGGEECLHPGH